MSQKTVASDADIPQHQEVPIRSNKRRNAIFIDKEEHIRLMKLIDD